MVSEPESPRVPPVRPWLMAVALFAIYLAGVGLAAHRFASLGLSAETPFWMESAQRFRGIRFLAEGQPLPDPDRRLQWPDGYRPTDDTVVQEHLYGALARLARPESLHTFVRWVTRFVSMLVVFPLFFLARRACGSPGAALWISALYVTLPPALEPAIGLYIFRQHLALPFLACHMAALVAYLDGGGSPKRENGLAALSGLSLLLALLTWKVIAFYQLFLLGFLAVCALRALPDRRLAKLILWVSVPPVLASVFLPVALRADRYWGGPHAALSMGLLLLCATSTWPRVAGGRAISRALLLLVGIAVAFLVLPGGRSYDHAWATLLAKVRFLGVKPADPGSLSVHARHYWTGNYRSPGAFQILDDFAVPGIPAAIALVFAIEAARRNRRRADRTTPRPAWTMSARALYLSLSVLAFGVAYLFFARFGNFFVLFLMPMAAIGVEAIRERLASRHALVTVLLVALLGASGLSAFTGAGLETLPDRLTGGREGAFEPPADRAPGVIFSEESLAELSQWLSGQTHRNEVVLASFALSPYLATYLDRPTILHCFFEGPAVDRYVEFTGDLFAELGTFHAFSRRYQADYVVLEAALLLRTDRWMSYRYVADRLNLTGNEACYRLHYSRGGEPGFELVYQNDFFRVFRVLRDPNETRLSTSRSIPPLFDISIAGAQPGRGLEEGPRLLYGVVESARLVRFAEMLDRGGRHDEAAQARRAAAVIRGSVCRPASQEP